MARKIFKSGNSAVVSLPEEALESLGLSIGSRIELRIDNDRNAIVLSPAREVEPDVGRDFTRKVEEFRRRYGPALRALADR